MAKVEKSVVDVALSRPTKVVVRGEEYEVPPLTLETILLASEAVASYVQAMDSKNYVSEVFRTAREYKNIGDLLAIMILGADNLIKVVEKKILFWKYDIKIDEKKILSDKIKKLTPEEYTLILTKLSKRKEIHDFFLLTTSLTEINILAPTREVE